MSHLKGQWQQEQVSFYVSFCILAECISGQTGATQKYQKGWFGSAKMNWSFFKVCALYVS